MRFTILLLVLALVAVAGAYCPGSNGKCRFVAPVAHANTLGSGGSGNYRVPRGASPKSGCYRLDDSTTPNNGVPSTCDPVSVSPSGIVTVTGQCGCYFCVQTTGVNGNVVVSSMIYTLIGNATYVSTPQATSVLLTSNAGLGGSGVLPPADCIGMPNQ